MTIVTQMMLLFLIVCAIAVCLTRNLLTSVIIYMGYSMIMSIIWITLESPDLAITEAAVGAAPPAGRRCKRPDRCADNDCTRLLLPRRQKYLGQMDELGELRRPRDLVAPLVAQKGLQRVEERRGLAALVPVHLAQHRQEPR